MEEHRSNPVCSACHATMDPLGFVLENFDATGRWRTEDAGVAIDAASAVPDGTAIDGPAAFRAYLLADRRHEFLRTVTEKLLAYALGRSVEPHDAPVVRQLIRDSARDGHRWSSLIQGLVQSPPFRMRRVPGSETGPVAAVATRP
jgi:hypothetical protein